MKRNVVTLIIVLLSFCLTGIICFQIYWVVNAYSVKEEQFDRSVFNAMNNISDKLETYETLSTASTKIDIEDEDGNDENKFSFNKFINDSLFKSLEELEHIDDSLENAFSKISNGSFQISISADDDSAKVQINNNGIKVIVNKKDSASNITGKNYEKVSIVKSKIDDRKKFISQIIKKMIVNVHTKDFPIEKRIQQNSIKSLIKNELSNNGITIPFEFGVTESQDSNNVSVKSKGFVSKMVSSKYKIPLFQKDIVQRSDLLIIEFPKKNKYIMSSLSVSMFVQILFTMIIIMVFAGTIFFIIKQKRISDMKNDFISNMTHEFKTPIATINLAIDSINNPKVLENAEMIQNFTRVIKEENNRMNAQVENILQISMLEKQELTLNTTLLNAHELIDSAVNKLRLQIECRNGSIKTKFNAEHAGIVADKDHLANAMINIIDNANKYSQENPEIIITTKNDYNTLIISVADKGIGMTEEVQQKIFDKFYRASTGNIHNIKGFGLGLSYVKAIIEAHKGAISVKSEPGKGSTFEITLPVTYTPC